jgi:protein gp37
LTTSTEFAGRIIKALARRAVHHSILPSHSWPLPNVWLGTSVENQEWADKRIPLLLETPAAVRFLSCEPLLGPIDLTPPDYRGSNVNRNLWLEGINWIIVGGESGPGARPMHPDWARSIRDRCIHRTDMRRPWPLPFFFKQWGGRTPKAGGRKLDGRTWDQMPVTDRTVTPELSLL